MSGGLFYCIRIFRASFSIMSCVTKLVIELSVLTYNADQADMLCLVYFVYCFCLWRAVVAIGVKTGVPSNLIVGVFI